MSTTSLPPAPPSPPAPSAPQSAGLPPQEPPRPTRSSSRTIAILTIALGAAVVLGTIVSAGVTTVAAAVVRSETRTIDTAGLSALAVDVDGASLRVEFADVDGANLEVTGGGGADEWTLERAGDSLTVASPQRGWFGWSGWFTRAFTDETRATLRLPQELADDAMDASFGLAAGDLVVEGNFDRLDVQVGAGSMTASGSARTLTAELSAGDADIDLADIEEAEFRVNAGSVDSRLTGSAPRTVVVDVSAGAVDLTLPAGAYDVRSDVSAGEFENGLRTEAGARNSVDVSVSAGSVIARSPR